MWNPVQDTTPIHTWLHPWLPPLGNRLEIVYPTIRNKLATALANWHPTDRYNGHMDKEFRGLILERKKNKKKLVN